MLDTALFEGRLVRLAVLEEKDAASIAEWYGDAGWLRLYDGTMAIPRTTGQIAEIIAHAAKEPTEILLGLRRIGDETLVGMAGLDGINTQHGRTSLSIAVAPSLWGRGYGRDGMELLLQFAFMELNLYRVGLTVFDYNERAIALYRSMGFVQEGVFRGFLRRDGARHDMLLMSLLVDEWKERA